MDIDLNDATFPKLLKMNAGRFGDRKAALRRKGMGIWQPVSWSQYFDSVRSVSLGLISLGFKKGDTLAIIGNNRPESLFAELAAQAAGGIPFHLYQDSTPQEVAFALHKFDAGFVIAEDQEQVDKVLECGVELPKITHIIHIEKRGLRKYRDKRLLLLHDLMKQGLEHGGKHPEVFEQMVAAGKSDDTALICLTSGTTGEPKGAMLSYRNLLSMSIAFNEADPKRVGEEFVSLLPLAWFGEQMMSVSTALVTGFTVNFPEKQETALADLREIGPHIMLSPPQVWESLSTSVRVRMMDSTPFKKFMFNTFMPVGEKVADCILAKKPVPAGLKFQRMLADICLFSALRDRLGLSRVHSALTGGAPLGPDVFRFFHAIGVDLKQLYGQTEISGISCMHRHGQVNGATVGTPLAGAEVRISGNGEILSRSPGVFQGYYKDEEATRAVLSDGWLHSGDAGEIDADGHLVVIDRLSEVITLSDGSRFPGQLIENRLKFSPYIREAIVVGGNSNRGALIAIDSRIVGKWAGDNKINFTTFSDLATRQEIVDLVEKELRTLNGNLPELARIRRFAVLYKELDADEGELTRTGKVRRDEVTRLYGDMIGAISSGLESIDIDKTIVFPDGKSGRIQTTVSIRSL